MADKDLDKGYNQFLEAVNKIIDNEVIQLHDFEVMYNKPAIMADVILNQITNRHII